MPATGTLGRRWLRRALAISLAAAPLGHAEPAVGAAPQQEATVGDKETARMLMDEGDGKYRAGDYRGALAAYRAADKIMDVPTTGIEVGRAEDKLGRLLEARDTWLRVARSPTKDEEPKPFTSARNEARRLAVAVAKRIPSLQIEIEGLAEGVEVSVWIDRVALPTGTHRHRRKVNPGERLIQASAPGYRTAVKRAKVSEGQNLLVELALEPLPSPAAGPLDGPGPGRATDGDEAAGGHVSSLVWVGIGVGAVGVAAGVVTGSLSWAATSDVEDSCEQDACPPSVENDIEHAELLANISNVGFGVAGVGAVLTIVGIALSGDDTDEPQRSAHRTPSPQGEVTVKPLIGPGWAGLSGQF